MLLRDEAALYVLHETVFWRVRLELYAPWNDIEIMVIAYDWSECAPLAVGVAVLGVRTMFYTMASGRVLSGLEHRRSRALPSLITSGKLRQSLPSRMESWCCHERTLEFLVGPARRLLVRAGDLCWM